MKLYTNYLYINCAYNFNKIITMWPNIEIYNLKVSAQCIITHFTLCYIMIQRPYFHIRLWQDTEFWNVFVFRYCSFVLAWAIITSRFAATKPANHINIVEYQIQNMQYLATLKALYSMHVKAYKFCIILV